MVAPVLLEDALLLLGQGIELACAALQVCVQAAQALPSPRGRLLLSDVGREAPSGCAQEGWPRQGCRQPTQPSGLALPWGSPGGPGTGSGQWPRPVSTEEERTQAQ